MSPPKSLTFDEPVHQGPPSTRCEKETKNLLVHYPAIDKI